MVIIKRNTALLIALVCIVSIIGIGGIKLKYQSSVAADAEVAKKEGIAVPILMYHSILKDIKRSGKYVITPTEVEDDLKFLKENGYTTVFMQDLIDYANGNGTLPAKPVVLTLDDGYYNNYSYVYPLLQKYQAKAVISIVGTYTDAYTETKDENPAYAHLSWENVKEMQESGLVEFQNHTYNMHQNDKGRSGCKKKRGESDEQYREVLTKDIGKLQQEMQEHLGFTAAVFTYPYGSVSEASYPILKDMGFQSTLSCQEGMNYITQNPEDLFMLKRYLRSSKRSAKEILK